MVVCATSAAFVLGLLPRITGTTFTDIPHPSPPRPTRCLRVQLHQDVRIDFQQMSLWEKHVCGAQAKLEALHGVDVIPRILEPRMANKQFWHHTLHQVSLAEGSDCVVARAPILLPM